MSGMRFRKYSASSSVQSWYWTFISSPLITDSCRSQGHKPFVRNRLMLARKRPLAAFHCSGCDGNAAAASAGCQWAVIGKVLERNPLRWTSWCSAGSETEHGSSRSSAGWLFIIQSPASFQLVTGSGVCWIRAGFPPEHCRISLARSGGSFALPLRLFVQVL